MTITAEIKNNLNIAASLAFRVVQGQPLTAWELSFIDDMTKRWDRFGDKTFVSDKQAAVIARIAAKAH